MPVTGTYRLQLHDGFTFADAESIVPYLADLGVSHLYLSPILQASSGSMHGYDVIDHAAIAQGLGGAAGFTSLAQAAHDHHLGIIVDVVPNHMAFVAPEFLNTALWEVLRDGRDARTAEWFDIDWKAGGGRMGMPILGAPLAEVLADGQITLDTMPDPLTPPTRADVPILRYFDHVLPVALGTEGSGGGGDDGPDIRAVLDRQHYRLTSWRDKDTLNYRRFFEIDQLIAVRVELPEVFEATHALLLDLNQRGLIDGFRIDHPDGLADPAGYLEQLRRSATKGTYIVVEKILEASERLPTTWACDGTTGYDGLRAISDALVDPADAQVLTQQWALAGGPATLSEAVDLAKRQVVGQSLIPEVERLTRRAREALPELDPDRLRMAVVELLVAGQVYRAYVRTDERVSAAAVEHLTGAFRRARAARPDLDEELKALIPLTVAGEHDPSALDFTTRLQQTWGPVMAKGIEDTTFYRWHRLIALNEVGGDPQGLDTGSGQELHEWAEHQVKDWPRGMTALSTHDTKRSEDVRARILAVAGDPDAWIECSTVARERAAEMGVDAPTAHLLWQTILGVGDIGTERMEAYLLKALREAKQGTAWVDGDEQYERRVLSFVEKVRSDGRLYDAIGRALAANAGATRATILAAKALQLTMPGVPDCYQGCEIVDLSLVDPDNRRPVDYGVRRDLLASLDEAGGLGGDSGLGEDSGGPAGAPRGLDAEKLLLTSRVLRLRRDEPDLLTGGSYAPVESASEHALGFVRASGGGIAGALGLRRTVRLVTLVTRAPARLAAAGGWGEASVDLPEGEWRDILTGRAFEGGPTSVAALLRELPIAVLLQR
ncbi:MAG: malto-oligosyltrehalose synthase [Dermatophilaceae bacterium]